MMAAEYIEGERAKAEEGIASALNPSFMSAKLFVGKAERRTYVSEHEQKPCL